MTGAPARIAVVDDDGIFIESLSHNLREAGYAVVAFGADRPAEDVVGAASDFDLILLDWKLPEASGIDLFRRLQATGAATPVLFLTGLDGQIYEETALRSGAVDFVDKSRSFTILASRVRLALGGARRGAGGVEGVGGDQVLSLGPLALDAASHRAQWRGLEVGLSITEFRMVALLAGRAGQDVRYRDLYDVVHGKDFLAGVGELGYRSNVRAFIKRIRQKFMLIDEEFDAIENYAGFGYRWRKDSAAG